MKKFADVRIDLSVSFHDNGVTCISDQALDAAIDKLGEVRSIHDLDGEIEVVGSVRDTESPVEKSKIVDMQRLYSHPLAARFHEMTQAIEALGASPELTAALNRLHALRQDVENELNRTGTTK